MAGGVSLSPIQHSSSLLYHLPRTLYAFMPPCQRLLLAPASKVDFCCHITQIDGRRLEHLNHRGKREALLARQAGQPVSALRALTLDRYISSLFESVNRAGNTPWILPVGVFHRRRRGVPFCPLCLQTEGFCGHSERCACLVGALNLAVIQLVADRLPVAAF